MDRSYLYLLLAVVLLSTYSYVALGSGEFFLYLYGATWCEDT